MRTLSLNPIPAGISSAKGAGQSAISAFRTSLPVAEKDAPRGWFPQLVELPVFPASAEWFPPLPSRAALGVLPSRKVAGKVPSFPSPAVVPAVTVEAAAFVAAAEDFTDNDLREAFSPIVEEAVRKAVYANERGLDTFLEPMLRATIRRALAEYAPASRPFQPPGFVDRLMWRMQALFSSRSYEEVLFEKTHRFQVDEVFLLDRATLALVSFASCDPARHSTAKRIEGTARRIALQLRDEEGKVRSEVDLGDGRKAVSQVGRYVVLVAVVRGRMSELVVSDLEFSLRRIEDHFQARFEEPGSPLMQVLQPFLEDCLLIQAPSSAA